MRSAQFEPCTVQNSVGNDWLCEDANDAIHISLIQSTECEDEQKDRAKGELLAQEFHPTFTYPIFGEAETILGYKNLKICLKFAASDMFPYLNIQYSEKMPSSHGVEAEDIEKLLREQFGEDFTLDENIFINHLKTVSKTYTPIGKKLDSYQINQQTFEIYKSNMTAESTKKFHAHIDPLCLFFIEGGSLIGQDDDRWDLYTLYQKTERSHIFAGYSTIYSYYFYDQNCGSFLRKRISQFLVLPPFRKNGHGGRLYDSIFNDLIADDNCKEITVEDPSEAFEDLRDRRDLARLEALQVFNDSEFRLPLSKDWLKKTRQENKMAPRQFNRCIEMALQQRIDPKDPKAHKSFRIHVKTRLFKNNYQTLMQLDKFERIEKIEETFNSVVEDYQRILKPLANVNPQCAISSPTDERPIKRQKKH